MRDTASLAKEVDLIELIVNANQYQALVFKARAHLLSALSALNLHRAQLALVIQEEPEEGILNSWGRLEGDVDALYHDALDGWGNVQDNNPTKVVTGIQTAIQDLALYRSDCDGFNPRKESVEAFRESMAQLARVATELQAALQEMQTYLALTSG